MTTLVAAARWPRGSASCRRSTRWFASASRSDSRSRSATSCRSRVLPQSMIKLLFTRRLGRTIPKGKEGLAAARRFDDHRGGLDASMRIDEINKALYPMAGSFGNQVDKEMTTFTASSTATTRPASCPIVLPQLLDARLPRGGLPAPQGRAAQRAQVQDLRSNNEEELGKERLQNVALRRHAVRPPDPGHARRASSRSRSTT